MFSEEQKLVLRSTRFSDLRWVEQTRSTNLDAIEAAQDGALSGLVVIADSQTGGRGRLGRSWVAPPRSSLLMSVFLAPDEPIEQWPWMGVAIALASRSVVASLCGVDLILKWPNDLLVRLASGDLRKVAGVLAEVASGRVIAGEAGSTNALGIVIGIGLNVLWPDERDQTVRHTAAALNDIVGDEAVPPVSELACQLLVEYDRLLELGPAFVVRRYGEVLATLGQRVRVELPGGVHLEGIASGLDGLSLRLVDDHSNQHIVSVGDVVHLRPIQS